MVVVGAFGCKAGVVTQQKSFMLSQVNFSNLILILFWCSNISRLSYSSRCLLSSNSSCSRRGLLNISLLHKTSHQPWSPTLGHLQCMPEPWQILPTLQAGKYFDTDVSKGYLLLTLLIVMSPTESFPQELLAY